MKIIPIKIEIAKVQNHGAVGSFSNYCVSPANYDLGDPVGYGVTRDIAIMDFKESWMIDRNEEIETRIVCLVGV